RASGANLPTVEGPKVYPRAEPPAQIEQPRQARMRRLGDAALHVEVKDRLRASSAELGQPPPFRVSATRHSLARRAVADKVDVHVIVVRRPIALEILQERRPVR